MSTLTADWEGPEDYAVMRSGVDDGVLGLLGAGHPLTSRMSAILLAATRSSQPCWKAR